MKNLLPNFHPLLLLVLLGLLVLAGSGCQTESENTSSRPWNQPKGWENGFPTRINEGR